jgi:hypothetical protein
VVDSGWAYSTFPTDACGRGVAPELAHVVEAELEAAGAVNPGAGSINDPYISLHGLHHGSSTVPRR